MENLKISERQRRYLQSNNKTDRLDRSQSQKNSKLKCSKKPTAKTFYTQLKYSLKMKAV